MEIKTSKKKYDYRLIKGRIFNSVEAKESELRPYVKGFSFPEFSRSDKKV